MKEIQQKMQQQLDNMTKNGKLFRSSISGGQIWDLYIKGFKNDPIFRDPESSVHNCNLCNNFIRRYGNIVSVSEDNKISSIWDIDVKDEYKESVKKISSSLSKAPIAEVFFETYAELNSLNYEKCSKSNSVFRLGIDKNHKRYTKEEALKFGVVKENEIRTFSHFHIDVPKEYVDQSGKSVESVISGYRDAKNVFQRAMEEISLDTLILVKDLINQGSLLDGATHLYKIEQIIPLKKAYDKLGASEKDNWCWNASYGLPFAKFRNELIGTLCSDLSEGKELNEACKLWNMRVDPANYMKATAPITKKQIEEAKKFVQENGYEESFDRRLATMDDIKVSEILYSNVGDGKIKPVSIFDTVKSTSTRHKKSEFDKVEEVTIEKFMKDILPGCTSVEAFLLNSHEGNLVSLTTAKNADSKAIFKWNNNYSWTFKGNLAGKSQIKEAVRSKGGNVEGVLRASMIWNEVGTDQSDLDIWCNQADRELIGFDTGYRKDRGNKFSNCSGQLDLDIQDPGKDVGVENIYFSDLNKMKEGEYEFWVNQFSARGSKGFKFEIEFDGERYQYNYNSPVRGNVKVAKVSLKDRKFTVKHILPPAESLETSKTIYGVETNMFHKVNLVCLSPNHWGDNAVGNKHYFFMLEGCKADAEVRGFHNENLIPELAAHRKVLEVLGTTSMISPTDRQIAGIGFNATVRDELILKLGGTFKRTIKVKF